MAFISAVIEASKPVGLAWCRFHDQGRSALDEAFFHQSAEPFKATSKDGARRRCRDRLFADHRE